MRAHLRRLTAFLLGATLATAALAVPVAAQDTTDSPPPASCEVLTADEVSGAFEETMTLENGAGTDCQFDADYAAGRFLSLFSAITTGSTIDELLSFMCGFGPSAAPGESVAPCSIDVTVGDARGVYLPEGFGTMLYVESGGSLLSLQLVGDPAEGVDKQAALVALAGIALPRLAAMPLPTQEPLPSFAPEPSLLGDAALEALFPADIGGIPIDVTSMSGQDLLAQATADVPQELTDALAAQGKTLADVSVAFGTAFDTADSSFASITAIQVHGADIAPIAQAFMPIMNDGQPPAAQTPGEVAGKAVTVVKPETDTSDENLIYAYIHDDVLWLVSAVEPDLTEVFLKLP